MYIVEAMYLEKPKTTLPFGMEGTASKPKPTVVRDTLWEKENSMLPVFFYRVRHRSL
jgi:hypothetical protein